MTEKSNARGRRPAKTHETATRKMDVETAAKREDSTNKVVFRYVGGMQAIVVVTDGESQYVTRGETFLSTPTAHLHASPDFERVNG